MSPRTHPRTLRRLAATAVCAATALTALAAAPASATPSFSEDSSAKVQVVGTYTPLTGNFAGSRDDILWYAPGATAEQLWTSTANNALGKKQTLAQQVNGTYTPIVGDFGGSRSLDDILWYAPGPAPDTLWIAKGDGTFDTSPVSIKGTYTPVVLGRDVNHKAHHELHDTIIWQAASGGDFAWQFDDLAPTGRNEKVVAVPDGAKAVVLNVDKTLNVYDEDVLWYRPGKAADVIWTNLSESFSFGTKAVSIEGTYVPTAVATAEDFGLFDSIVWYSATGSDPIWVFTNDGIDGKTTNIGGGAKGVAVTGGAGGPARAFYQRSTGADQVTDPVTGTTETSSNTDIDGSPIAVAGQFRGFPEDGDVLWYRPGAGQEIFFF